MVIALYLIDMNMSEFRETSPVHFDETTMARVPSEKRHWVRLVVASLGIAILAFVWSRMESGNSHPTEAGDQIVAVEQSRLVAPSDVAPLSQLPSPVAGTTVTSDEHQTLGSSRFTQKGVPMPDAPLSPSSGRDDEIKAHLVGTWVHTKHGHQWLEIRADGTARMLMKLDRLSALVYGAHTTLELTWALSDSLMSQTVVGGTPEDHVGKLVSDFGKTRQFKVLETTIETMLLETLDNDRSQDHWTRSETPPEWLNMTQEDKK